MVISALVHQGLLCALRMTGFIFFFPKFLNDPFEHSNGPTFTEHLKLFCLEDYCPVFRCSCQGVTQIHFTLKIYFLL